MAGGVTDKNWGKLLLVTICSALYLVTVISVYSRNQLSSSSAFAAQIREWTKGVSPQIALDAVSTYGDMTTYIQSTLHGNVQSPSALGAQEKYLANPDVVQAVYFLIGNTSDFVIGAFQVLEIAAGNLTSDCVDNRLVNQLKISCLPEYRIGTWSTDVIVGELGVYSVADASAELVFDLSLFSPNPASRVVAVQFNVLNVNTGNVGIACVLFERSVHGQYTAGASVTVVPPAFVYLGGRRSGLDWATVVGGIFIIIASTLFLLIAPITKALKLGRLLFIPSLSEILLMSVALLTVVAFGLEFSVVDANPLVTADLGISPYVDLQWVARRFGVVNGLHAITILVLGHFALFRVFEFFHLKSIFPIVLAWTAVLVAFASVFTLRFPSILSFADSVNLLVRVALGNVSHSELVFLSNGFPMVTLLVLFLMVYIWFIGLAIGTFLSTGGPGRSVAKLIYRKTRTLLLGLEDDQEDRALHPELKAGELTARGKQAKAAAAVAADDALATSVEMMAGKALGELERVKEGVELRFRALRVELEETAEIVRGTQKMLDGVWPKSVTQG